METNAFINTILSPQGTEIPGAQMAVGFQRLGTACSPLADSLRRSRARPADPDREAGRPALVRGQDRLGRPRLRQPPPFGMVCVLYSVRLASRFIRPVSYVPIGRPGAFRIGIPWNADWALQNAF